MLDCLANFGDTREWLVTALMAMAGDAAVLSRFSVFELRLLFFAGHSGLEHLRRLEFDDLEAIR